jgi:hypothetical protein
MVLGNEAKITHGNIRTLEYARRQDFTKERGPENLGKDFSLCHVRQFLLTALEHSGYKNIFFKYLLYMYVTNI